MSLNLLRRLSWQRWLRWSLLALVTGVVIGLVGQWAERRELHNRIQALQQAAQSTVLGLGGIAAKHGYLPYHSPTEPVTGSTMPVM